MDRSSDLDQPLLDTRVVDFSTHLPGPFATMRLQEFGATVLKVEPPNGDPAREMLAGAIFDAVNQGKRSIQLDLKQEADHQAAVDICREADIIVEGFRPSVAQRLGVTPDALLDAESDRPQLFCSVRPSTQDDDLRTGRVHDLNVVARSGLLQIPGSWSRRSDLPARPALPLADIAVGERLAQLVVAWRAGGADGRSDRLVHLEVGMLEALKNWARIREVTMDGDEAVHLDPANDCYQTADGRWLTVAALEEAAWRGMCELLPIGNEDRELLRELDAGGRRRSGDLVASLLRAAFLTAPISRWLPELADVGVSVAEVAAPASHSFQPPPSADDPLTPCTRVPALDEAASAFLAGGAGWEALQAGR
jgi:crotonobetainyl-CoA:carnitine CoA-transferase CaiB-like acyl-CoA transferase